MIDQNFNWFYHTFHQEPLIVYIKQPWSYPELLNFDQPMSVIVGFLTNRHEHHEQCLQWLRDRKLKFKNHHYEVLCDTEDLTNWFISQGQSANFINENSFHDEKVFNILECEKVYPLVYVAAADHYKNLWLLKEIEYDCLWICGRITDEELHDRVKAYPKVFMPEKPRLSKLEIVEALNRSMFGLCLSRQEASMRASCEYVLCGLPVINVQTTGGRYSANSCGRETLLDSRHIITVNDVSQRALNVAVKDALGVNFDARLIRKSYLEKRKPHRLRFIECLNRCAKHLGLGEIYSHKNSFPIHCNFNWRPVKNLLASN